jgi:L-alanine-DL-glutamate epimerase-like enolase superfamily enzyme
VNLELQKVKCVTALLEQGFTAVKLHTGIRGAFGRPSGARDDTVTTARCLRERVGDAGRLELLIDVNGAYDRRSAVRVGRMLKALEVVHFEEPLAPWDLEGYRELAATLDVPVAAGEQLEPLAVRCAHRTGGSGRGAAERDHGGWLHAARPDRGLGPAPQPPARVA